MTTRRQQEARVTAAVTRFRRQLIDNDAVAQAQFVKSLETSYDALITELETAMSNAQRAQLLGTPPNVFRVQRAAELVRQAEAQLQAFAETSGQEIAASQREATQAAFGNAQQLIDGVMGTPPTGLPNVSSFMTYPTEALRTLTGSLNDGPVQELLNRYGADAAKSAGNILTSAIVTGTNPDVWKKQLRKALDVPLWKAALIARTETNRVYRESLRETWAANKHIVPKWIWRSGRSLSTCAVCWAMDGREFDSDTPMGTHPGCRCCLVPKTISWEQLAKMHHVTMPPGDWSIPKERTGPEVFQSLTAAEKARILGKAKFAAFDAGEIELRDLVHLSRSTDWGTTRREGGLKDAKARAAKRGTPAASINNPPAATPPTPPPSQPPSGGGGQPPSQPPISRADLLAKIHPLEDSIYKDLSETAILVDPDTGDELWRQAGQQYEVGFTQAQLTSMQGKILLHNHPRGWGFPTTDPQHEGNSFSNSDILTSISTDLQEIRATTPIWRYSMRPGPSGWGPAHIAQRELDDFDYQVRKELDKLLFSGQITQAEGNALWAHEIMKRFAAKHGHIYERELR